MSMCDVMAVVVVDVHRDTQGGTVTSPNNQHDDSNWRNSALKKEEKSAEYSNPEKFQIRLRSNSVRGSD